MKRLFLILITLLCSTQIYPYEYKFSFVIGASKCHRTEYIMDIFAEGNSTQTFDRLVIPAPWTTTLIIPRSELWRFYNAYIEAVDKYYEWREKIKTIDNLKSFSKEIPIPFAVDGCYCSKNDMAFGRGKKISTTPKKTNVIFKFFVPNFGDPSIAIYVTGLEPWDSFCFYLSGTAIEEFRLTIFYAEQLYLSNPQIQADILLN